MFIVSLLLSFITRRLHDHLLSRCLGLSLLVGLAVGYFPYFANEDHRNPNTETGSFEALESVTLDLSRLVLGLQLVYSGVRLPGRFLRLEWRSLALLLGPGLVVMWACSGLIIYLLVPSLPVLAALAIAACVTPTDPVLSASILQGHFADENLPEDLRNVIIAESGANDGLGYLFVFFALRLFKWTGPDSPSTGGVGEAMSIYLSYTCLYVVISSILYGAFIGWATKVLVQWATRKKLMDSESFFATATSMGLFILGTCGMAGVDDVLACFIAGNTLTWDDWFRVRTEDDSFEPTADSILNVVMFVWLGAACPWRLFFTTELLPIWRLLLIALMILLFRRLPIILTMKPYIRQIQHWRHALFVGYFGPIGVSAILYLHLGLQFTQRLVAADGSRRDISMLNEAMTIITWFMVAVSVVRAPFPQIYKSLCLRK